jgi:nitrogen fixation protein FixH
MPTTVQFESVNTREPSRRLTGRLVLAIFCGFFGVIFAMNGLFMFFAFSTFGGIDAAGAYRKNFLLTEDLVAAEKQSSLGWSVKGSIVRSGRKSAEISVSANDRSGHPIEIKSLEVEMRRPTDKRLDAVISLRQVASNRFDGQASGIEAGQWDVLITLFNTQGQRFHSRNRIVLD